MESLTPGTIISVEYVLYHADEIVHQLERMDQQIRDLQHDLRVADRHIWDDHLVNERRWRQHRWWHHFRFWGSRHG